MISKNKMTRDPQILGISGHLIVGNCYGAQAVEQFWIVPRHFNTTGPCKPNLHYMLPPTDRLPNLERVVEQQNYLGIILIAKISDTSIHPIA